MYIYHSKSLLYCEKKILCDTAAYNFIIWIFKTHFTENCTESYGVALRAGSGLKFHVFMSEIIKSIQEFYLRRIIHQFLQITCGGMQQQQQQHRISQHLQYSETQRSLKYWEGGRSRNLKILWKLPQNSVDTFNLTFSDQLERKLDWCCCRAQPKVVIINSLW